MQTVCRFALLVSGLALGVPVAAQSVDATSIPPTGSAGPSAHEPIPHAGQPKSNLWDNGAFVTQTGVGAGGADVSEIEPGLSLFGWGHQFTLGYRIADDFTVPAGSQWTLGRLRWLAYQTNATTTGTITGIYTEYVAGADPNSTTVVGGDATTNQLVSTQWTGVYRVTSTTLTNSQRALIEVEAKIPAGMSPLPSGQYWIRTMCDGTLSSGPWCPVTVPWDAQDNSHQELGLGAGFQPTTQGFGGTPGDAPFWLDSDPPCGPGGCVFCIPRLTSCGSTPTLTGPASTLSLGGGAGTFDVLLANVPDPTNGGGPAVLIHSPSIPPLPVPTDFGFLCLSGFFRGPGVGPPGPGGPGNCDGVYTWDFGAYAAANAGAFGLLAGNTLYYQAWARDPANAANPPFGTANFSDANGPIDLVP